MKCEKCEDKAIFLEPTLCKKHFIDYFEKKVKDTIEKYNLIPKNKTVCVAVSGGKDSLTVLNILHKLNYNPKALLIDEGIDGYREKTIIDAKEFCNKHKITLNIASFKEEFKETLDQIMKTNTHPCKICGTFRRYLLNKHTRDFDIIATGHNADDESQVVLMNIIKANTNLMHRLGPKTNSLMKDNPFTQRIKPLYFCTEKEVMTYAIINNIKNTFTECPNIDNSFRNKVRDSLNAITTPQSKQNILKRYLKELSILDMPQERAQVCKECGEPSKGEICKTCQLRKEVLYKSIK